MYKYLIIRLKEYIFIILTATIFFLSTLSNCKAEQNVFTVDNIEIKAEMNLNFSRETYVDKALKKSFEVLMSQILLAQDLKKINKTTLKKIKNLIDSFQIIEESYRNNVYEAKFNIFYSDIKVKKFLGRKNISFSQPKKISAIFFPLLVVNNEIIPLEQNFFYNEWLEASIKNELINFILPLEDLEDVSKCFVSFELFEHLHSPEEFLLHLNSLMHPNDLFIFTTLSGTGLDIQVLWENSLSVFPPHHLNFINPYSIKMIINKTGFKCIEVSTPGKLDIDVLANNKEHIKDKFWSTFIETANEKQKQKWQDIITQSGWSSHMMVVCKK